MISRNQQPILTAFLRELRNCSSYFITTAECTKVLDPLASHFKRDDEEIWRKSWPLCYIECILNIFGIHSINSVTQALTQYASDVDTGKGWECVIFAGIYIWCLDAMHSPVVDGIQQCGPFNIADRGISNFTYVTPPGDGPAAIRTIPAAMDYFRGYNLSDRNVLLATPCYAKYTDYDGFLCCGQPDGRPPIVVGFQCKKNRSYTKHPVPDEIFKGVMLRGNAPLSEFHKQKWEYYNEEQVREVLGWSRSLRIGGTCQQRIAFSSRSPLYTCRRNVSHGYLDSDVYQYIYVFHCCGNY